LFLLAMSSPQALVAQSPPPGFTYETVVQTGLNSATAMAFAPDGRLFLTERSTGHIRVIQDGVLLPAPWATIAVNSGGSSAEQGLLGIAIDPAFPINRYVYVYYTDASGNENRIARLQEQSGVGTNLTVLSPAGAIPSILYHNGGPLVFGRDGTLFVGTGDGLGGSNAQDLGQWRGKILRFEVPNLTVPSTNPIPGSAIYSYGHRNQFGLTIHPVTGDLFQTENGGALMDEINRIVPGGNYGWPGVEGREVVPNAAWVDPLAWYQPTTALTGCAFYSGANYPAAYSNVFFFTDYNQSHVHAVTLDATAQIVVSETLFDDQPGAGYAVTMGPDGNLWYLTNDNGGYGERADAVAERDGDVQSLRRWLDDRCRARAQRRHRRPVHVADPPADAGADAVGQRMDPARRQPAGVRDVGRQSWLPRLAGRQRPHAARPRSALPGRRAGAVRRVDADQPDDVRAARVSSIAPPGRASSYLWHRRNAVAVRWRTEAPSTAAAVEDLATGRRGEVSLAPPQRGGRTLANGSTQHRCGGGGPGHGPPRGGISGTAATRWPYAGEPKHPAPLRWWRTWPRAAAGRLLAYLRCPFL